MRKILFVVTCAILVSCGRDHKRSHDAAPAPQDSPRTSDTPPDAPQSDGYNLVEREADLIAKYKAIGVELSLWAGQAAKVRDVEIKQLVQLLPEIKKRTRFVSRLEISAYHAHWYVNAAKLLRVDLEKGVPAAVQYLGVFDQVRAYEARLGGARLERAGETAAILTDDLAFYDKVDLAGLLQDRAYIKVIHPSGWLQFIQNGGVLYIKTDVTAEQLKQKLDDLGRWQQLTEDLGIEIEDKVGTVLSDSFTKAIDALQQQAGLIKPVVDLVKKIEIIGDFSDMTFDLDTGIFKMSHYDAAISADLWLALAEYKTITSALAIPIDIPDYMRDQGEPLKDGLKLVVDNLDVVRAKLDKIKGLRVGAGNETKMAPGGILWLGYEQDSQQFKAFVESL